MIPATLTTLSSLAERVAISTDIDELKPYSWTQATDGNDILNIGGFSDAVFSVVAAFLAEDTGRFVAEVEAVEL
ncbi:MAG: hypothetical protein ACYTG0_15130 [Planctomycetota bacterium]|jgi:hypothetical protein